MRWSSHIQTGLHVPRSTRYYLRSYHFVYRTFTLCCLLFQNSSTMIRFCNSYGNGLLPFQSPLLRESLLLSFPPGTKMFQFSGCCSSLTMYSLTGTNSSNWWVAPFGYLRILVHLQLPVAFRCSSRPSSPSSAKASTVHSFFLNLTNFFNSYLKINNHYLLSTCTIQFSKIY